MRGLHETDCAKALDHSKACTCALRVNYADPVARADSQLDAGDGAHSAIVRPKRESLAVSNLTGCARCGKDHGDVLAEKLERPIVTEGRTFTYWIACPTNGQPIMVEVRPATT